MKSNREEKQTYVQETSNSVFKINKRIRYKSSVSDETVYRIEKGYKKCTVKENSMGLFKNKEISQVPYKRKRLGKKLQNSINTAKRLNNNRNIIKKSADKKKIQDKEKNKNKLNYTNKINFKTKFNLKQLIVKIPQLEDKYHQKCKISSKEKNDARGKDGLLKEYVCKCSIIPSVCKNQKINGKFQNDVGMNENAKILLTNKNTCMKELIVKLTNILNISETSKKKNKIIFKIPESSQTSVQYENDMLKRPKATGFYNLRHLQPKTYFEDSTINTNESVLGCKDKTVNINAKQRNEIPIYQKVLLEKKKNNKEVDLYEFVDNSPKKKTLKLNVRKSSIFDKSIHDILTTIEQKEAKAKKKHVRKKINGFKCAVAPKKSYKNIIDNMVSDIKKIMKNDAAKPVFKQTNNGAQALSNKILTLKSINIMSDGHKHDTLNSSLGNVIPQIIHLNDFNHENIISVHQSPKVPFSNKTAVSQQSICLNTSKNMDNANKFNGVKIGNNRVIIHSNIVLSKEVPKIYLSPHTDDAVLSQEETSAIDIRNDVECCFGFDVDVPLYISTVKSVTNDSVKNINYLHGQNNHYVESPTDFNIRRPNANSTMIHFKTINKNSSPWRPNWKNVKQNPHFVSIKSNGLPRIDQELVLDHTLVKKFERHSSFQNEKLTGKELPIQLSILDFVEGNVEFGNEYTDQNNFKCELFNSLTKNTKMNKDYQETVTCGKKNLEKKRNIITSTPIKRKVLGDISNSEEQIYVEPSMESETLFGFNDGLFGTNKSTSVEKSTDWNLDLENDDQICSEDSANRPKPSRFDLTVLKSYLVKDRKKKKKIIANKVVQAPNQSVSLVQTSIEDKLDSNIHLFEEPEEILDKMSPPQLTKKSHRRKRLDSCNSDLGNCELKRKRHKKTKSESPPQLTKKSHRRKRLDSCNSDLGNCELKRKRHKKTMSEIEQEEWINKFNQMCKEIEQHELELD